MCYGSLSPGISLLVVHTIEDVEEEPCFICEIVHNWRRLNDRCLSHRRRRGRRSLCRRRIRGRPGDTSERIKHEGCVLGGGSGRGSLWKRLWTRLHHWLRRWTRWPIETRTVFKSSIAEVTNKTKTKKKQQNTKRRTEERALVWALVWEAAVVHDSWRAVSSRSSCGLRGCHAGWWSIYRTDTLWAGCLSDAAP